jgi:hypothetical protein
MSVECTRNNYLKKLVLYEWIEKMYEWIEKSCFFGNVSNLVAY